MLVFACILAIACAAPSQTHIALTGKTGEIYVTYSTTANVTGSVQYGVTNSSLNSTVASSVTKIY